MDNLLVRSVSVLSNSGTGTQDITFTGGTSFVPKAAIIQWSGITTSNNTLQDAYNYGIGFTDGTNQRCSTLASKDNIGTSDTGMSHRNDSLIISFVPNTSTAAFDSQAAFSSWLTDGIQINWTNAPVTPFYLDVMLLGGDAITNVKVGTLSTGTGTGNVSDTSLSFKGDFGMFITSGTAAINTIATNAALINIGAATSSSAQWSQSVFTADAQVGAMATRCYYSHAKVSAYLVGTLQAHAAFSSFNSNGFTLNIIDAYPSSFPVFYLILKGGVYSVGNGSTAASPGNQTVTTDKDTKGVMMFGLRTGTPDVIQNGNNFSGGMGTSSTEQGMIGFDDLNAAATSAIASKHDSTRIYANIVANATAASSTFNNEASLVSVSSTGFVLDWSDLGSVLPYRYITFGDDTQVFPHSYGKIHTHFDNNTGAAIFG